jgi:hypothetical protein
MLRYFIIATVLVVGTIVVVTALHPYRLRIVVGAGRGTIAPKPASSLAPATTSPHGLRGDAPWALSALPECLIQSEEWTGTLAAVRNHLPASATRISPPAKLDYADCTVTIVDDWATVTRGDTRLRIPPFATFYRVAGSGLALLRSSGCTTAKCPAVLRVYATPAPNR